MEKRLGSESLHLDSPYRKSQSRFFPESTELTVQRLNSENHRLLRENLSLQTQIERLKSELRLQQEAERSLQSQLANARQDLEMRITRRPSGPEEPYALMSKLSAMESQKRISENEIASLRFEMERTVRMKSAVEGQNNYLKSEILRLKTELEGETSTRLQLLTLHENSQRESDQLRAEIGELKLEVALRRQELLTSDRQMQELNSQLTTAMETVRRLEQEYDSLTVNHSLAVSQNIKTEQIVSDIEKEKQGLKAVETRLADCQTERAKIAAELTAKNSELQRKADEISRLERALSDRERDLADLRADTELLQRQITTLTQEKDVHQQRAAALSKKLTAVETDFKTIDDELCRLHQEKGLLEDKVTENQRKIGQVERLESDVKRYRQQYLEALDGEKDARAKLEAFEQRLEDDRSQFEKTQGVMQRKQRMFEESQTQIVQLTEDNSRLESLISELETAKNALAIQLDQAADAREAAESTVRRLDEELKAAKDAVAAKDKELKQAVEATQRESHENLFLRKLAEEHKEQQEKLSKEVRGKEQDCSEALDKITKLQRELDEVKSRKREEVETLDETILHLQDEVYRLEQDRDRLKQAYESASRSERVSQQLLKTLEKEKEGLLVTQKKSLEDHLDQSNSDSGRMMDYEQRVRDQDELIAHYRAQIQSLESDGRRRPRSTDSGKRSDPGKEIASLYSELEMERLRVEQLEEMLQEQKMINAEMREELTQSPESKATMKPGTEEEDFHSRVDRQREEVLSLEMEVMRLRDELGKSKHLQFKSDARVRELERKLTSVQSQSELAESLET